MALQSQTYANSGNPYYGHPADWSLYSTIQDTIRFNSTNAVLLVTPAVPDSQTTISFNGEQLAYASDIPDLANWAQYPANHDVNIPSTFTLNASLANISTVNVSTLNVVETNITTINASTINADTVHVSSIYYSTIAITANNGTDVTTAGSVKVVAGNGAFGSIGLTANAGAGGISGGNISLTANGGTAPAGLYGLIDIQANPGVATVSGTNVTTGGYINIQANSGNIVSPSLTSRIDLNAGGLNFYSGLLSPIASEFGYTFMNASAGISVVAGNFSPSFQVPGSVYVYGTSGIVLGSDVYGGNVYPRFNGIDPPDNLSINGRSELVGNAFVDVNDINQLSFSGDINASKAINGLSTINGLPLSDFQYNPDPQFSTITMNNEGLIEVTQIRNTFPGDDFTIAQENGTGVLSLSQIPPLAINPIGDITILNNGEINLNTMLGDGITISPTGDILNFQTTGAPRGQIAGLITINGNMSIGADGNSIEFVPPPPSLITQGQISGVSTINGVAYPPPYVVNFVDAQAIYVAPNGDDTVGTGSSQFPYETIGRAITARALLSNTLEVSIMLSPGTYTETFTITRNTYLVGVQTGEARQPCNIVGDINMNDATGTTGLSGLDVNGTVTTTGAAAHTIFACNITGATNIALNATAGTAFVTECRLTSSGSDVIRSSSTLNIRDCIITQSGVNNCISSSTSCTIRQCIITSTSTSTSVQPIVFFNNSNAATSEISFCNITYTSAVTSTTGEKACIAYGNTGTHTASVSNSLLICEGAIAPLGGGPILCIQAINSGALTLSYGQIIAGTNANRLPVTGLSKIPYVTAV
jgi:hypothetical protein